MPQSRTLYVGLAVHTASSAVASVAKEPHAEVVALGTIGPRPCASDTLVRQLPSNRTHLVFVYAAGPGGYGLDRSLTQKGQGCWGGAPSLLPKKPADRVTTTRRDASTRARRMRAGDLTPVSVPPVEDAARRDLGRGRAEALRALQTAPLRRQAFLLRQALRCTGRATWGPAPLRWRSEVVCPPPAQQSVCQAYLRAVPAHPDRLQRLAPDRPDQGHTWRLAPVGDALPALRGVPCPGAVTTVAALGDRPRCAPPRQRMPSLGVPPAAYSTGARRRQGGIPKPGNTPARRALVEGAWTSRSPATVSRPLQLRLEQGPKPRPDRSGKAQRRLGQRSRQLLARGTNAHQVVVAIARELRACMWARAQEGSRTPSRAPIDSPAAVCTRC